MSKKSKKSFRKSVVMVGAVLSGIFAGMQYIAKRKKENAVKDEDLNTDVYEHQGEAKVYTRTTIYEKYIKTAGDKLLSFFALVLLAPVFGLVSLAILIDDPGPVLFTQKRVGKNKEYFRIHKFRSMKVSTPKNMPTHMLENPEQYITKVGKFIRKYSLDELPQIWDIFVGNMSFVGPRPALWNQNDLIEIRDKYGANDVKPGLTGWAQINGRDELEIEVKAKLDGEYVKLLKKNSFAGFGMDVKCLVGTVSSVIKSEGVVEGGTGEMKKEAFEELPKNAQIDENEILNYSEPKQILIAGAGSYIGDSFKSYLSQWDNYIVEVIDTKDASWREKDFSKYDVLFDVAGIAHIKETQENRKLYYDVNRDLAIELAKKAKQDGVAQFIYLSSMSVYGLTVGKIDKKTKVNPVNAYGKSKLEAEIELWKLRDNNFVVSIVRPPMVYGKGCKGNYQTLRKFALKVGFFPDYQNARSMIFIDNLSSAIRGIIHNCKNGVYYPQDLEYTCTSEMVNAIANCNNLKLKSTRVFNIPIKLLKKKIGIIQKVFGNLVYDRELNVPADWIQIKSNYTCFEMTEKNKHLMNTVTEKEKLKKKILVLMSTYNGEKYLADQIESIIRQETDADVLLKIRDDGSTDKTCQIISQLSEKYPERILWEEGNNKGYNASFFELMRSADGFDYYAISDQDDIWMPDKLQTAIKSLQKEDESQPLLYASTSWLVEDDMVPYGTTRKKRIEFTLNNTIIQNICPGHTQVFNNALLQLIQEDIDINRIYVYDSWITNLAMLYGRIVFDNTPHTFYRQHKGNQLGSGTGMIGQLLASRKRAEHGDGKNYRRQIEYFYELHKDVIKLVEESDEIKKFINMKSLPNKFAFLFKSGLYRQNNLETIAFKLAVMLGKY